MELKKCFKTPRNSDKSNKIRKNFLALMTKHKAPFSAKESQFYARHKGIKNAFCHTFIYRLNTEFFISSHSKPFLLRLTTRKKPPASTLPSHKNTRSATCIGSLLRLRCPKS